MTNEGIPLPEAITPVTNTEDNIVINKPSPSKIRREAFNALFGSNRKRPIKLVAESHVTEEEGRKLDLITKYLGISKNKYLQECLILNLLVDFNVLRMKKPEIVKLFEAREAAMKIVTDSKERDKEITNAITGMNNETLKKDEEEYKASLKLDEKTLKTELKKIKQEAEEADWD